jgi:hypothetical protein
MVVALKCNGRNAGVTFMVSESNIYEPRVTINNHNDDGDDDEEGE